METIKARVTLNEITERILKSGKNEQDAKNMLHALTTFWSLEDEVKELRSRVSNLEISNTALLLENKKLKQENENLKQGL